MVFFFFFFLLSFVEVQEAERIDGCLFLHHPVNSQAKYEKLHRQNGSVSTTIHIKGGGGDTSIPYRVKIK